MNQTQKLTAGSPSPVAQVIFFHLFIVPGKPISVKLFVL